MMNRGSRFLSLPLSPPPRRQESPLPRRRPRRSLPPRSPPPRFPPPRSPLRRSQPRNQRLRQRRNRLRPLQLPLIRLRNRMPRYLRRSQPRNQRRNRLRPLQFPLIRLRNLRRNRLRNLLRNQRLRPAAEMWMWDGLRICCNFPLRLYFPLGNAKMKKPGETGVRICRSR